MKSDYDCICEILKKGDQNPSNQIPPEVQAVFDEGMQLLKSNAELLTEVTEFLSSGEASTPRNIKKSLERIAKFIKAAKARGTEYWTGAEIIEDFKMKFMMSGTSHSESDMKAKAAAASFEEGHPQIVAAARSIIPQTLFMRFFFMLAPKQRLRLIEFMEEHELCGDEKAEELREKINADVVKDEKRIGELHDQSKRGRMDCFDWLQWMLFDFFNGILAEESRNDELRDELKQERKRKEEASRGTPESFSQTKAAPEAKPPSEGLEIEMLKLRNELATKEERFALKMEAEKQFASQQRQALENELEKLAENCDRKLKLSAHAFETFLDTLPRKHSASGYLMLRSIVNEWDGDLHSVQAKERKYSQGNEAESAGKGFGKSIKSAWWIIAILLLLFTAICFDAVLLTKQAKTAAETHTEGRKESVVEYPKSYERSASTSTDETLSLIDSLQSLQDRRKLEASR